MDDPSKSSAVPDATTTRIAGQSSAFGVAVSFLSIALLGFLWLQASRARQKLRALTWAVPPGSNVGKRTLFADTMRDGGGELDMDDTMVVRVKGGLGEDTVTLHTERSPDLARPVIILSCHDSAWEAIKASKNVETDVLVTLLVLSLGNVVAAGVAVVLWTLEVSPDLLSSLAGNTLLVIAPLLLLSAKLLFSKAREGWSLRKLEGKFDQIGLETVFLAIKESVEGSVRLLVPVFSMSYILTRRKPPANPRTGSEAEEPREAQGTPDSAPRTGSEAEALGTAASAPRTGSEAEKPREPLGTSVSAPTIEGHDGGAGSQAAIEPATSSGVDAQGVIQSSDTPFEAFKKRLRRLDDVQWFPLQSRLYGGFEALYKEEAYAETGGFEAAWLGKLLEKLDAGERNRTLSSVVLSYLRWSILLADLESNPRQPDNSEVEESKENKIQMPAIKLEEARLLDGEGRPTITFGQADTSGGSQSGAREYFVPFVMLDTISISKAGGTLDQHWAAYQGRKQMQSQDSLLRHLFELSGKKEPTDAEDVWAFINRITDDSRSGPIRTICDLKLDEPEAEDPVQEQQEGGPQPGPRALGAAGDRRREANVGRPVTGAGAGSGSEGGFAETPASNQDASEGGASKTAGFNQVASEGGANETPGSNQGASEGGFSEMAGSKQDAVTVDIESGH